VQLCVWFNSVFWFGFFFMPDLPQSLPGSSIGGAGAETHNNETIRFEWRVEYLTHELLINLGFIIIKWAWIDHEITQMCESFWFSEHPDKQLPQSFSKRATILQGFVADLYLTREPDEYRIFAWYLQRVRTVNGKRDNLAHGRFGKITRRGRTYDALSVPVPSGANKYIPMSMKAIERLAEEINDLLSETPEVSYALSRARAASSSREIHRALVDGEWTQLTWDNRSPKLPRRHLPPSTWNP
jgi:hypothetical protein